jgi:hypothetical protein
MFTKWAWEFTSRLSVNGNKFVITLPIDKVLTIQSIKYTRIGNWIELHGIMDPPKVSSIINIDGNRTEAETYNLSRAERVSCGTNKREEKTWTETKAKARTEQLF